MSATALTDVQLLMGMMELGEFTGEFDLYAEAAMKECTNFACRGYTKVVPGATSAYASLKGYADYATGAVSSTFLSTTAGAQYGFSVLPTGSAAVAGDPAFLMRGRLGAMKMATGSIGDPTAFEMTLTGDNAGVDGAVAVPLATRGAVTGTPVQLGAVSAERRLWAAVHVTAGTFTNLVVTIESDALVGFGSPTTVITAATVSAAGWQFLSVAGAVADDWFRAKATIGSGTANYAVVFGIL